MNRKIKFRIWDYELKKFSTSFFDDEFVTYTASICPTTGGIYWTGTKNGEEVCYNDDHEEECKTRFVLQQFTGLQDKDGKDIYEGDIVKGLEFVIDNNPRTMIEKVKYDSWFGYDWTNFDVSVPLEVIGNIFENPELLKT
jgi:uncharacterized phage protein (TIGR01671 family)